MILERAAIRSGFGVALAVALVLTACSGGSASNDDGIDAIDGSREADDVDVATIESTTTTTTTTSSTTSTTTTSTTTTSTSTTLPIDPPVDPALCDIVGRYYTTARILTFIDPNVPFELEVTITAIGIAVDEVLRVGEGDADADPWRDARGHLDVVAGLEAIDWDASRTEELVDPDVVAGALVAVADGIDATGTFLVAECGTTTAQIGELDAGAQELAADVSADASVPTESIEITDDTGRITMSVPGGWTDVIRSPQGDVSRLAAAPDLQAFDNTFAADGGFVLAIDVSDPDAWRSSFDSSVESLLADGCVLLEEVPYDDGVYTGAEGRFDCGAPGKTLDLFGGRDAAGLLAVLGQVVRPVGDTTSRDVIVGSFLIS